MIITCLTVFSAFQLNQTSNTAPKPKPVLKIPLGLLGQMGLEGEDEPCIMMTKKISSEEEVSETQVREDPRPSSSKPSDAKLPPRCPPFQKQKKTKTPAEIEKDIISTRKSSRQHKPSSWYSSDSYVLGNKKAKDYNPPPLIGFIPGDISPRISPNQLKKRKLAGQREFLIPTASPTPVTSTTQRNPSPFRYLFCMLRYFWVSNNVL